MRIIVILLSLTALGLSACQGNRLNGSASSSVAIGPLASFPAAKASFAGGYASPASSLAKTRSM